jgi:CubicO group peptidase (beta-lactamase class C family)
MSLADYLSEKLWKPMGMNDDALWHTDGQGLELAYCCISSNARNFAKFGQLLLDDGVWKGQQLLSKDFAIAMRISQAVDSYGYSLWINNENNPPFYQLQGHLGQYVTVIPRENMIVIRLGRQRDRTTDSLNGIVPIYVKHALSLAK